MFADGTVALEGLDLAFETGEFIVLLGPSGSGKTTACRLLAGLEEPTAGTLWVDGRDITALPPRQRGMSMVFQNYALYAHKTVYENIAYPLRIRKAPRAEIDRMVRSDRGACCRSRSSSTGARASSRAARRSGSRSRARWSGSPRSA